MTQTVGGMELRGSTVLILGGAGLVGEAVARALLAQGPTRVVIAGLTREEAEESVAELQEEFGHTGIAIDPFWGDLFVPADMKDRPRREILDDPVARELLVNDLYGELTDEVYHRSSLGKLLLEVRPDIVIDSINTAGALAYQNFFSSALSLRENARAAGLATLRKLRDRSVYRELEKKAGYYWDNPGFSQTESHPVTCVSWNDAVAFIRWLKDTGKKNVLVVTKSQTLVTQFKGDIASYGIGHASYGH